MVEEAINMRKPYIRNCRECGEEFRVPSTLFKLCWSCKTKRKGFYRPKGWQTLSRKLREEFSSCNICGDTKNLHVHHIDMNRENNDPSNLQIKCGQCHISGHKNLGKSVIKIMFGQFGKRLMYEENVEKDKISRISKGLLRFKGV